MTHRSLFIAILAAAGVLAAAQPALAGTDVRDVRTTDPAPGGRASWIESRVAGSGWLAHLAKNRIYVCQPIARPS